MKKFNVGIIGLGTIGSEVYKILSSSRAVLKSQIGLDICVKRICDKNVKNLSSKLKNSSKFTKDADEVLNDPDIEIIVELIGGIMPAKRYLIKALKNKKHVVTANKALLAENLNLFDIAYKNKRLIKFEASVGGGIPIIRTIQKSFAVDKILNLYGIVNGTSNYILSHMEQDDYVTFKDALKQAQDMGYAESDPSFDINGMDSAHKLIVLSNLCFGTNLKPNNIYCEGISNIQHSDIKYAEEAGYKIKLLAIGKVASGKLELRVHPTLIEENHLLASVKGIYNAIYLESKLVGKTLFFGEGAGSKPTGNAVVSDIVDIARNIKHGGMDIREELASKKEKLVLKNINDIFTRYYIRFMAIDKPGVLAKISDILGKHNISISSVIQKERKKAKVVPIVMMTHEVSEFDLQKAMNKIKRLNIVKNKPVVIRIESGERG